MEQGTFHKVGKSENRMFGRPCTIICGYRASEQKEMRALLEECGLGALPSIFVGSGDSQRPVSEIAGMSTSPAEGVDSDLKRAVIMSGHTEKQIHLLLKSYRERAMPAQLWATVTPVSHDWTLGQLLEELSREAASLRKRG